MKAHIFSDTAKRVLLLCVTLAMLVSALPIVPFRSSALSDNPDDILFDAEYYATHNGDVVAALGNSYDALHGHYVNCGKAEGRAPSELFDPRGYLAANGDVKAAYGEDFVAAYNHFVGCGIAEGRYGGNTFHLDIYCKNYADLRNAFGTDYLKYYKHWREYGKSEGRNCTSLISAAPAVQQQAPAKKSLTKVMLENGCTYAILAHGSDMAVNVQYAFGSEANIVLDRFNGENNEMWIAHYVSQFDAWYFSPVHAPECSLNAFGGKDAHAGDQIKIFASSNTDTDLACLWYVYQNDDGTYSFENLATGYWTDVDGGGRTAGTRLNLWYRYEDGTTTPNQRFELKKIETNSPAPAAPQNNPSPAPASNGLVAPVVNCYFNKKTSDGNWYGYHDINIGVSVGTPVYAIADGTVTFYQAYKIDANGQKYLTSYGNHIVFESDDGVYTAKYCHLNAFEGVQLTISSDRTANESGKKDMLTLGSMHVSAGQVIGYIGKTGHATGVHLHFELYKNGTRIDPTSVIPGLTK